MHPSKHDLALDFIRRGIRGVQQAELTLERYVQLAKEHGCRPDEIAAVIRRSTLGSGSSNSD
jgi:hypothetical protein